MQLFTLVSLVLALSGATYTAIAAVYKAFEESFNQAIATAESGVEIVRGACDANSHTHKLCCGLLKAMHALRWVWTYIRAVPTTLFVLAVYYIAGCAVFNWDRLSAATPNLTEFPWWTFPLVFRWMFWTCLGSVFASILIFIACRLLGRSLKTRSNAIRDVQANALQRAVSVLPLQPKLPILNAVNAAEAKVEKPVAPVESVPAPPSA